ncbi:MAG TPA: hypothetical protein VGH05_14875 [Buttiauxella sp.]
MQTTSNTQLSSRLCKRKTACGTGCRAQAVEKSAGLNHTNFLEFIGREKMIQDFQDIKNEFDKYGPEQGEEVAQAMYEALSERLTPYFFNQDNVFKRRLLAKLEEGERDVGTKKRYDWLDAFNRNKPEGR